MYKRNVRNRYNRSPYYNPLRIVLKNDDSVRVCFLDAQQLNKHIQDDQEAPPIIEKILLKFYDCPQKMKYFCKVSERFHERTETFQKYFHERFLK